MRNIVSKLCFAALSLLLGTAALGDFDSQEPIAPLPLLAPNTDPAKAELGALLFKEKALSKGHQVSCASCHDLAHGGADTNPRAIGVGGKMGTNSPTVFNSIYGFRQFWDGRAQTLEEQIDIALRSPVAMAGEWPQVVKDLSQIPDYVKRFKKIYPRGISKESISDAIAAYEATLTTPNAPIDRFLRGDQTALTERQKQGYQRFKTFGCIACHQGMNIGGNMYQTMGVMGNYFAGREETKADLGRFNSTNNPSDRHVFKVPSLRNVALTAPYFHDGSAKSLRDAVRTMGRYQLGRNLSDADLDLLVDFLGTLTGQHPALQPAEKSR